MEQLNFIHLRGCIGSVRIETVGDTRMARFSMATNRAYRDKNDGIPVVETQWHQIIALENEWITRESLDALARGLYVDVKGRLQVKRYSDADGNDKSAVEIIASKVKVFPERVILANQTDPLPDDKEN